MERTDGYIDINKLIENGQAHVIKKAIDYTLIRLNHKEYYFRNSSRWLNSIMAYHICQKMGIKAAFCDYAKFGQYTGIISESIYKENVEYLQGAELLEKYFLAQGKDIKELMSNSQNKNLNNLNNLEIIWYAIDYLLKDMQVDTTSLMYNIVLLHIYTLLTFDHDQTAEDWLIEVKSGKASLAPTYDNEYCFHAISEYELALSSQFRVKEESWEDSVKAFLDISSSEYLELFMNNYHLIYEDGFLDEIFSLVEKQIGISIPEEKKLEVIDTYQTLKDRLNKIIEEYNQTKSR